MLSTDYPDVNQLLETLLARIQTALPQKLVALYLCGSLVYGDFDAQISDVDLVAIITSALDDGELTQLAAMHQQIAAENPVWDDRIEVIYLTQDALKTFRTQASVIAITSPGEPFHTKEADKAWLMNWYLVREQGVTLFGPPPQSVIPPIATEEFVEITRHHAKSWAQWVDDCRNLGAQAYAILTLCRALYTILHGTSEHRAQTSKVRAAAWAAQRYPQWAALIQGALLWRKESLSVTSSEQVEAVDPELTFAETKRFVHFAIAEVSTDSNTGSSADSSAAPKST
jgi:hypothetical protein